jgi:hypothetical protein
VGRLRRRLEGQPRAQRRSHAPAFERRQVHEQAIASAGDLDEADAALVVPVVNVRLERLSRR